MENASRSSTGGIGRGGTDTIFSLHHFLPGVEGGRPPHERLMALGGTFPLSHRIGWHGGTVTFSGGRKWLAPRRIRRPSQCANPPRAAWHTGTVIRPARL